MATGKVQPLRSPERERLAAAIERHAAAVAQLAAITAAQEDARDANWAANAAAERAAEALAAARADEPRQYVAKLLGKAEDAAMTVEFAEAAAHKADGQVSLTQRARELLDVAERDARAAIEWAKDRLREAVGAVGSSDPAVAKVIERYHSARQRVQELGDVMSCLNGESMLPREERNYDAFRVYPAATAIAAPWQAAVAALQANADASLPSAAPSENEAA